MPKYTPPQFSHRGPDESVAPTTMTDSRLLLASMGPELDNLGRVSGELQEAAAKRAADIDPDADAIAAQDEMTWLGIVVCFSSAVCIAGTIYLLVKACGGP